MPRSDEPTTFTRISLSEARALLGKYYPDEIGIGREKLVRALAAGDVPYWPADPDLAALWRKLSGQDNNQQIQHVRSEGDWIEFYLNGVRRAIGPIYVGREAVVALLPVERTRHQAQHRHLHLTRRQNSRQARKTPERSDPCASSTRPMAGCRPVWTSKPYAG